MRPLAAEIAARGIKVDRQRRRRQSAGLPALRCRRCLHELGVRLSVAVVLGDDVSA